ncbi:MAG: MFS transporter [Acidobacteria bacterium]|nr:MFS transporter [Acidobacteriota bacterium]
MSTSEPRRPASVVRLGLRENLGQFALLVVVNAFVGAMVGMERSILPAIAEQQFHLAARTAVLSFIVAFGVAKALTNYGAGRLSDRVGRKQVLVLGWLVAVPVPFLLMWARSWNGVLLANLLLGISQGLTWSTTVIMKIDLVGAERRGLAMGLNEFAGYLAVAASALATGWIAAEYGMRPQPFYLGVAFVIVGFTLSAFVVRDTTHHVSHESALVGALSPGGMPSPREVFWRTTFSDRNLSSISQAGLVNNLNDGMAWGLFPLVFAAASMNLRQIGWLAAIYPATWGVGQLVTGALSDRTGRKWLIAAGMWTQAGGIALISVANVFAGFAAGAVLLGIGTAMVYPTLLAAVGDVAHPSWRASAVGVYRLWRDLGYAVGALLAGITADAFGLGAAMWVIAALTFASGLVSAVRMTETLPGRLRAIPSEPVSRIRHNPHFTSSTRPRDPEGPLGASGMASTLFILNDPPYGNERSYNALRLAGSLSKREGEQVKVFLVGDAASCAQRGQKTPQGCYNVEVMLRAVTKHGGDVGVCGSCMDARGITESELVDGAKRSSMDELAAWTAEANKIVTF